MFETRMKLSLFTEVWEVSCTNHFVQLKQCLAFDGPWSHKYPQKNESSAYTEDTEICIPSIPGFIGVVFCYPYTIHCS